MEYHLIYPDDYRPTEKQLRAWLKDAIANEEVDLIGDLPCCSLGEVDTLPIEDVARILNDTGNVTLVPVQ